MDRLELAAFMLEPHFDAVRDCFVEFEPEPGEALIKLRRTRLVVDDSVRTSERHYAACRDDGLLIKIAPEATSLDARTLTAIIAHEFGHAADFAYPGRWLAFQDEPAIWLSEGGAWVRDRHGDMQWNPETGAEAKQVRKWQRMWHRRSDAQVEWAADSIAYAVTGHKIGYCGPCMIQCFSGGRPRPESLR